jgi:hypothetical protein
MCPMFACQLRTPRVTTEVMSDSSPENAPFVRGCVELLNPIVDTTCMILDSLTICTKSYGLP